MSAGFSAAGPASTWCAELGDLPGFRPFVPDALDMIGDMPRLARLASARHAGGPAARRTTPPVPFASPLPAFSSGSISLCLPKAGEQTNTAFRLISSAHL